MTGLLKPQANLLTLIEGPYPTNPTKATLQSDRLLLIGGGIGITGLLTYTSCHPNFKLFVGVKTIDEELVTSLQPMLDEIREKHIIVGARLDIEGLLREEANLGWSRVAVVVCGPASMCDDVRAVVAQLGKEKAGQCLFELEVDAFSW
jgi:NAD(P)H-flavin reductase